MAPQARNCARIKNQKALFVEGLFGLTFHCFSSTLCFLQAVVCALSSELFTFYFLLVSRMSLFRFKIWFAFHCSNTNH